MLRPIYSRERMPVRIAEAGCALERVWTCSNMRKSRTRTGIRTPAREPVAITTTVRYVYGFLPMETFIFNTANYCCVYFTYSLTLH